jgi:hypothetical protein
MYWKTSHRRLTGERNASNPINSKFLKKIGMKDDGLLTAAGLMTRWYGSYEILCQLDVVQKVREKIMEDSEKAFLVS